MASGLGLVFHQIFVLVVRYGSDFFAGSVLASLAQGFMLGKYVMGLESTFGTWIFAAITAVFLAVGYSFIGACWIILKTDGVLQEKAVGWAKGGIWGLITGIGAVSLATPWVSQRIFDKWFTFPEFFLLLPLQYSMKSNY